MKGLRTPSSHLSVTDPAAARALADPEVRRILAPFMGQACTVKSAAAQLGLGLNATLLRVRRLVRLGLVHIEREEQRGGSPVKHYRAVAAAFFVSYRLTPYATPAAWMLADFAGREQQLAQAVMASGLAWGEALGHTDFGTRVFRREDGVLEADFAFSYEHEADLQDPAAPAVANFMLETELDDASAKALQRELVSLVKAYERRAGGKRYLLRLGLAPLAADPRDI